MKLLISALETSSNIHLKEVVKYLDGVELFGIFDNSIAKPTYDITQMAVMGFADALKKLPFFLRLNKKMLNLAKEADKILLMDGSGFNLPLAKKIKKTYPNKEIIYYILPQAWAWRRGRIPVIESNCDKLCSILPFEKEYYLQKEKITYVGHPLLDEIPNFRQTIINSNKIVFMPGSRVGEITKLMPIFREVAKYFKNYELVLVIPKHLISKKDKIYGDISNFEISTNAYKELFEAKFAYICSGTATLEAALIGTSFVLTYIANKIDYLIAKKLVKLNYIGLSNIFFEKMGKNSFHQELIQNEVTVKNLIKAYEISNEEDFLKNSKILRSYLKFGSAKNVAKIIDKNALT